MKRALTLGLLIALSAACAKHESGAKATPTPTPTPSPLVDAYDQEIDADDSTDIRLEVRQDVMNYFKNAHPKWQVKGLSLSHFDGDTTYYIGADISDSSTTKVVQLRAWSFIDDNGKTYRKIVEIEGQ